MNTSRCRSGSFDSAAVSCRRRSSDKHLLLRARASRRKILRRVAFDARRVDRRRRHPPLAAPARLQPVQASVDQDAREPDLERQLLAERADVHVRLHERVLHGLVGVGRVAQVVERDAERPALMPGDQLGIPLAGRVEPSGGLQGLTSTATRASASRALTGGGWSPDMGYVPARREFTYDFSRRGRDPAI